MDYLNPLDDRCICCLNDRGPLVNIKTCKHAYILEILTNNEIVCYGGGFVCYMCHGRLRTMCRFKTQVENNYQALLARVPLDQKLNLTISHHGGNTNDSTESPTKTDLTDELLDIKVDVKEEITVEDEQIDSGGYQTPKHSLSNDEEEVYLPQVHSEMEHTKERENEKEYSSGSDTISSDTEEMFREVNFTEKGMKLDRERERQMPSYANRKYKCEKCILGFDHVKTFEEHNIKKHTQEPGTVRCNVCHTVFGSQEALSKHAFKHYRRYECLICKKLFIYAVRAKEHYNSEHRENKKYYKCKQCPFQCLKARLLKYHMYSHKERVKCNLCATTFSSANALNKHIILKHKEQETYKCEHCNKELKSPTYLRTHTRTCKMAPNREEPKMVFCVVCNKLMKESFYKTHLQLSPAHNKKPPTFACDKCDRIFKARYQLTDHVNYDHLNIKQQCSECDKSFCSKRRLDRHVKFVHEKFEPPKDKICDHCGKGFTTTRMLKIHIRTHTGERPLRCNYCDATFAHPSALYNHKRLKHKHKKKQ